MAKNQAAVMLGRMARGVPKRLTDEQREVLAQRMREVVRQREEKRARARAQARAELGLEPIQNDVDPNLTSVTIAS